MSITHPTYGRINTELLARLEKVVPDQDGPFFMLNLMRYRPLAVYEDGRAATLTGVQADDLYAPIEILSEVGADITLFGEVVEQQRGSVGWHRVAMVRYPTVRSFLDMYARPDYVERHDHKDAGMERTVIAMCRPVSGGIAESTAPLLIDLAAGKPDGLVAQPGEVLLRVDGVLVGEATDYGVLRLRPLGAGTAPGDDLLAAAGSATTVTTAPLLNTLPVWLPVAATA